MARSRPLRLLALLLTLALLGPAVAAGAQPARTSAALAIVDWIANWFIVDRGDDRPSKSTAAVGPDADPNGLVSVPVPGADPDPAGQTPPGSGDIGADADPDG